MPLKCKELCLSFECNIIDFQKASVLQLKSLGSEQRVAAKITGFCRYIASTPLAAVCVPIQRRRSWQSLIIFLPNHNFNAISVCEDPMHESYCPDSNWCISARRSLACCFNFGCNVVIMSKATKFGYKLLRVSVLSWWILSIFPSWRF